MNRFNLNLTDAARFSTRPVVQPVAAREVPAHIAAEWTGGAKPESAADRVRRLLEQ